MGTDEHTEAAAQVPLPLPLPTPPPPLNLVKPLQISLIMDPPELSPESAAVAGSPENTTVEIEAVNLSYKASRESKFLAKVVSLYNGSPRCELDLPKSRLIVKNVSFKARAGEVLAIAGPSGAGKSTVLELLAGQIRPSSPPESLLINRRPMHVPSFRRLSGYVPQSDALFPLLTVRETLLFSAHLRLPQALPAAEKAARVDRLLIELRLNHVANSRIGNDDNLRGVSGGERRRVSIGVDVIHDPAVLFLDEPTSGLDSASALNVVEMLHSMAKARSRTVILSIHQPGYKIIQLIHTFLLLDNGTVMHHGSLQQLQYHLAANGHRIPPHVNVLEYAIEAIACNTYDHKKKTITFADHLKHGAESDAANDDDDAASSSSAGVFGGTHGAAPPRFACNPLKETLILSQRFMRNVFRTYELFTARTMQALFAGLALGTLYININSPNKGPRGMAERLGFFAFTLTFLLSSTVEALPIFLQERVVFVRETSRGAYRISSYMIANLVVFLPFQLFLALLFCGPVYWLVGLSATPSAFFFFIMVVWLVLLSANSFVAFFGALVPDYIMGNSIISGCMGAFFLFSGYFIAKEDMPSYWRFMHYLSLFKYPLDALLINEYTAIPDRCFGSLIPDGPCTITGLEVLDTLGLQNLSKWCPVFMLITFIIFYRLLCYIVLRFKVCRRKR